jgi:ElaB/YqjD/DUF883 family membrane-anchored ribosome-binding protein
MHTPTYSFDPDHNSQADSAKKPHEYASGPALEFKRFILDIEDLITQTTSLSGDELQQAKNKLRNLLQDAQTSLHDTRVSVGRHLTQGAHVADHFIHEHPWQALGVGAALGCILGLLLRSTK